MNVFSGDSKDAEIGRKWLKSALEKEIVEIVFTKKDGSERVMKCTLKEDVLPMIRSDDGTSIKSKSKEVLAVWDVESEGWRSFRWDSIKSVSFSLF